MILEKACIIELGLGAFPHIEAFAVHHDPHIRTEFDELTRRHIVGCANRVDAVAFEYLQLTLYCSSVDCCTKSAEIVMYTYAFELHVSAVQTEPSIRVKLQCPETKDVSDRVNNFALRREQFTDHFIRHRGLYIPKTGIYRVERRP